MVFSINALVTAVIVLVIIGVVLWAINVKVPMDSTFKTVINVIVILGLCLWLLSFFGIIGGVHVTR